MAVEFFKKVYQRIFQKNSVVTGSCGMCGLCCKGLSIYDDGKWMSNSKEFESLCEKSPQYKNLTVINKTDRGYLVFECKLLSENNVCLDYENRFPFCKKYPDKNLLSLGGNLIDECGYSFVKHKNFQYFLNKKMKLSKQF